MCRWVAVALIFLVLFSGLSSASATVPVKIVSGVVSNVASVLVKWLWSLKSKTKATVSSRSMLKFEGGYTVETVFDGSKLGIEPFNVRISPGGELLVLDSENSNIYKISTPLSRYSRPKLIAGSTEGYSGHVDGKLRDARMNHPKGLTVDDRGNIYIADTMNAAIRKISDEGVTTIAGGKWTRGGGHIDGPSEDAKFSNDFDVVYIGSTCSILVVDRGNQAIREIQLHDDDCDHQDDSTFHLGIAMLAGAVFLGYLLAFLQGRAQAWFSSHHDSETYIKQGQPISPYQRPPKSVRPPLIPNEDEPEKPDEGFLGSLGKLVINTGSTVGEICGGLFSGFRRKPPQYQFPLQPYQQPLQYPSAWPVQESFEIPDEDEPPQLETRALTPKKTYPFMTKELEQNHHFKQSRGSYNSRDSDYHHHHQQQQQQQQMQMPMQHQRQQMQMPMQHQRQQMQMPMQHQRQQKQIQMQMQQHRQQQQHHHRHYSSNTKTYYEKSCETNEIVFGAVQEQDGRREAVVIKAVDYADPRYSHHNIRPRLNYVGYSQGY